MGRSYEDLPLAPIMDVPSDRVKTGTWRVFKPIIEFDKCTKCYVCWKFCPDLAIYIDSDEYPKISYDYCKGCGICANECPPQCIIMEKED